MAKAKFTDGAKGFKTRKTDSSSVTGVLRSEITMLEESDRGNVIYNEWEHPSHRAKEKGSVVGGGTLDSTKGKHPKKAG
tara:strand:- start:782 stop:1018 length:237 start_codon:yes stop_codon:yes gene_type:complete